MGNMFIVNAPMLFSGIWAVVKGFLDEKTRNKIKILGANFLPGRMRTPPARSGVPAQGETSHKHHDGQGSVRVLPNREREQIVNGASKVKGEGKALYLGQDRGDGECQTHQRN